MAETLLQLPDNYIYISHLGEDGKYFIIPSWPDQIQDRMQSTFASTSALSRTAPVYTYSHSGPRTIQVTFDLHRDTMNEFNLNVSNVELKEAGDDYVDVLIKSIQAISVPKYNVNNRAIEPPLVALRFGNDVFIKGIVTGTVAVTYQKPILSNNKYAQVSVSFEVYETDPYDATSISKNGSFRGMTRTMSKGFNYELD